MPSYALERLKLFEHFLKSTVERLSFLEQLGYKLHKIKYGHILFSTDVVDINVYYERISFEIYLIVTLKPQNISCSIDEIARMNNNLYVKRQYEYAANVEMIDKAITEIALILKNCGKNFTSGNFMFFEEIQKKKQENNNVLLLKELLRETEKKALLAWNNKDYSTVINEYSFILKHLTKSQRKRLDICIKKQSMIKAIEANVDDDERDWNDDIHI